MFYSIDENCFDFPVRDGGHHSTTIPATAAENLVDSALLPVTAFHQQLPTNLPGSSGRYPTRLSPIPTHQTHHLLAGKNSLVLYYVAVQNTSDLH
jgi:hypothetical protein